MADQNAEEALDRRRVRYRYRSLEDFLIANPLHADGQLDDGWGAAYPVKGREIEATVLFADISSFSARTLHLTPAETLAFVNNFFAWITAEALRGGHGVVDKYIGDEIMVVFSKEFGATDPFAEAVHTARWIAENDSLSFGPHIGVASGRVIVGYVGTPLKYSASVFGAPVTMAARCAGVPPQRKEGQYISSTIVFPGAEWGERDFDEVLPPVKVRIPEELSKSGKVEYEDHPHAWKLLEPRSVDLKNLPATEIREIVNEMMHLASQSAEDRARDAIMWMKKHGAYRPRWSEQKPGT